MFVVEGKPGTNKRIQIHFLPGDNRIARLNIGRVSMFLIASIRLQNHFARIGSSVQHDIRFNIQWE
jgi:hypothetical protein